MSTRMIRWFFWPTAVLLVLGTSFLMYRYSRPPRDRNQGVHASQNDKDKEPNTGDPGEDPEPSEPTHVSVVNPRRGAMERITTQPCTVEADEVSLHTQVSGLLKWLGDPTSTVPASQMIDIGSVVKKGDVLAIIDVPEIEKQKERNVAALEQAKARVGQMKAKVEIAKANVDAARAQITYTETFARAATAWVIFRKMKYDRFESLVAKTSIEGALLDEAKEQLEAAKESENAAKAAIITSKAKAMSEEAKVLLAKADILEAEAQVKVAKAELDYSQVRLDFAKVRAQFDGIITQRPVFRGAFIRSAADSGGTPQTILTVQRTDVMRVVVQIPDREARFADKGDPAIVEIDGLPDKKFHAKLSRTAKSEDRGTRLMRVEIDLDNPDGLIRQGMFGKATIILDPALKQLSIPRACLVGKTADGNCSVYIIGEDGKPVRTPVRIGMDHHGKRVEVLSGLKATDRVVFHPPTSFADGVEVHATLIDETKMD